jgi:VanZ family protein
MIEDSASWVAVFGSGGEVVVATGLLGMLALAVAAAAPSSRLLVGATGLSLALVLGVTVVPSGGWRQFAVAPSALDSIAANLRPRPGDLTAWAHAADGPPNVALFVPLGLSLALLLRRPLLAAVLAIALSLVVESYQASLTTRVGSFADVVANGLGALVGAALATVLLAAQGVRSHGRSRVQPGR